jgi:hypothetical protein
MVVKRILLDRKRLLICRIKNGVIICSIEKTRKVGTESSGATRRDVDAGLMRFATP